MAGRYAVCGKRFPARDSESLNGNAIRMSCGSSLSRRSYAAIAPGRPIIDSDGYSLV